VIPGYDSQYAGESAFLQLATPGMEGTFQVYFANTGTVTWRKGTPTEVALAVCLPDKTTCNVDSPLKAWNDGSWISDRVYATAVQSEVAPGQLGSFIWRFKVPANVTTGNYRFNGDLMQRASGLMIHPEGYYQDNTAAVN
jgi:hypothetical protein